MRLDELLTSYANAFSLPNHVVDLAREMLERLRRMGLSQGRNGETLVAAVLYIACKQSQHPVQLKDMLQRKKGFLKTLRKVSEALGYSTVADQRQSAQIFLRMVANKLGLEPYVEEAASILHRYGEHTHVAATAALYVAAAPSCSLTEVTKASGFSVVAICRRAKAIREKLWIQVKNSERGFGATSPALQPQAQQASRPASQQERV
ncbi:probable transcription initiation factor IIB [Candidatus Caldarchaeum subterraneum]|uniref:Transcription initiation factor IIB n=1 Tax=Caldiarchaeum subterraneum TaxID=311458 RepID=E6N6Q7_CALS0|nr:probable transcription initiation factor IIB [Candidatus Caldarchaeum subterraneum]BAJ48008.1 probable transcription initiation factor IIB [Candidatus Caldarchaeum subterraneum]BAJ50808.1 probable transcription initiation factor IIB [Candidatus Caldarchaeum subterraneum]